MFKFQFARTVEPTAPEWHAPPAAGRAAFDRAELEHAALLAPSEFAYRWCGTHAMCAWGGAIAMRSRRLGGCPSRRDGAIPSRRLRGDVFHRREPSASANTPLYTSVEQARACVTGRAGECMRACFHACL
jgi:hypothetical protein